MNDSAYKRLVFWVMTAALILLVLGAYLRLYPPHALSHEAPSGWQYPSDCCSGQDCRPVSCDSLVEMRDGVHFLNSVFKSGQVRVSGDSQCHVCIGYTPAGLISTPEPHCVFVKPSS